MESGTHLLVVLISAWGLGHIAEAFRLPAAVGQVLAGVLIASSGDFLGPYIPMMAGISSSEAVIGIGEVGIFFLLLYAGIEMKPAEIASHGKEALAVAFGGVLVPLVSGFLLAWYMLPESDARILQAFVVGVALSISAIAVAAKVFMDFNLLHHAIGRVVMAAAVIDDIIGLVLLGLLTSVIATGSLPDLPALGILLSQVLLFFVATWLAGHYLSAAIWRFINKVHMPGMRLMALLSIALIYGQFAEMLGLHFILGPFMAGLYFSPEVVGDKEYRATDNTVNSVTKGVLGPVFFASIGLMVDPGALFEVPGFLITLLIVAMAGKLIGCGLPAWLLNGHRLTDAAAIGIGMSGRGAVELFIVNIAWQAGLFDVGKGEGYHPIVANLYSALILTAIITTALTPLLLRLVLHQSHGRPQQE